MQLNTYLPPNTKSGTGTLVLTTTYGYNAADQLTSRSETGSATPFRGYAYNYSYDANGSLTAETNSVNGGEVTAYSYDARNRLVKVQKQAKATNLSTASFGYDGNNTRTSLTYGGQSTAYLQDSGGGLPVVLQETSGSQSPSSLLYSSGSTSPLYQNDPNGNGMWYHKDGLGSVRALTNSSGTVNSTNSYSAFGVSTGASGKANNDHVFAGEQLDPTGLYFNRARYYSPGIGRFIGRDSDAGSPSQPLSENLYTYAWDNPTNLTDLTKLPWERAGRKK